ncbi:hypothetical protein, partial [Serratia marcescens]|uniref:hypothetical protein n=1 Tax=Serratia marcescens TaxID=615 RepID=UPI00235EAC16
TARIWRISPRLSSWPHQRPWRATEMRSAPVRRAPPTPGPGTAPTPHLIRYRQAADVDRPAPAVCI